jgi:polysaccharide biosynthesis transport protein
MQPTVIVSESDVGDVSLPLSHYLWILRRHVWKLTAFVAAAVLGTAIVSLRMTPVYESAATLYVDRQEAKGIVGADAQVPGYSNLDAESFLASQIRMVQSDSVVRPVAQKFDLLERERQIKGCTDCFEAFARGASPASLQQIRVRRTRHPQPVSYRSEDAQLAADVANGVAVSYIEHTYNIRIRSSSSLSKFMERQLEEMRAKVEASTARLAGLERELNVMRQQGDDAA